MRAQPGIRTSTVVSHRWILRELGTVTYELTFTRIFNVTVTDLTASSIRGWRGEFSTSLSRIFALTNMIQHHSIHINPMLSTRAPNISTSAHQPVPGGGTRRDHNAGKVRHDRSARRAGGHALLASASLHAPRDTGRNDVRGSPRLHARETQLHAKVPCSGQEPPDVALRWPW